MQQDLMIFPPFPWQTLSSNHNQISYLHASWRWGFSPTRTSRDSHENLVEVQRYPSITVWMPSAVGTESEETENVSLSMTT